MTDITFLSTLGWTALVFVAWAVVVIGAARAFVTRRQARKAGARIVRRRLVVWALAAVLLAVATIGSYAYRPKNQVPQDDTARQHRLQELDASAPIVIPPASRSLTESADWQAVKAKNIEDNRATVDRFAELPEGDVQ